MYNMFSPVTMTHKEQYLSLWRESLQHSMDYSLVNVWGWRAYFDLHWYFEDNICWLCQKNPIPTLWAPVGRWQDVDWARHPFLQKGATLIRVPEMLAHLLEQAMPTRVHIEAARGHWEYVYSRDELVRLSGNRFHKKRNHVNAYKKIYGEPDYKPIDADSIEDILALQDEWCRWHECAGSPALQAENEAINRVLSHWEEIPALLGGALYVKNMLIAFSIGEILDKHTLGVHYEKGREGFRGVYQVINSYFAKESGLETTLVNRAQDLDEEGLRQAKMTYLPVDFLRKYTVTVSPAR